MSQRRFFGLVAGVMEQLSALVASTGVGDAFKIVATGADGKLDNSLMPNGIGAQTTIATASETLGAGKFVNYFDNAGAFSARLADNSNGRPANGYVLTEFTVGQPAVVYPLDGVNSALTGLVVAGAYYLGTAGGVIATPLDEETEAGTGKISQALGIAKSATELVTDDSPAYVL